MPFPTADPGMCTAQCPSQDRTHRHPHTGQRLTYASAVFPCTFIKGCESMPVTTDDVSFRVCLRVCRTTSRSCGRCFMCSRPNGPSQRRSGSACLETSKCTTPTLRRFIPSKCSDACVRLCLADFARGGGLVVAGRSSPCRSSAC